MSRDTWAADPARAVPADEILRVVGECGPVDGVTISGGEPLDQPDDLIALLVDLRSLPKLRGGDILCYSGRTTRFIRRRHPELLALVDAVVAGPYDWRRPCDDPLRGSANQSVLRVTRLGRERYPESPGAAGRGTREGRRIQVALDQDRVRTIGVPAVGDLAALEAAAAAAGLGIAAASWQTEAGGHR
jgi:anaerobic ribonucleoside-triphosphate reductase activating protein